MGSRDILREFAEPALRQLKVVHAAEDDQANRHAPCRLPAEGRQAAQGSPPAPLADRPNSDRRHGSDD